ncbi:hypothetical protein AOLI_G00041450 [Acnodon oligacanthus]
MFSISAEGWCDFHQHRLTHSPHVFLQKLRGLPARSASSHNPPRAGCVEGRNQQPTVIPPHSRHLSTWAPEETRQMMCAFHPTGCITALLWAVYSDRPIRFLEEPWSLFTASALHTLLDNHTLSTDTHQHGQ